MEGVNRESINNKLISLAEDFLVFFEEMKHYEMLNFKKISVNSSHFNLLKEISYLLVLVVCVILVAYNLGPDPRFDLGETISYFVYVLGLIIMVIYCMLFGLWMILNAQLDLKKTVREHGGEYNEVRT